MFKFFSTLIAFFITLTLCINAVLAQAYEYTFPGEHIKNFHSDITVNTDGSINVVETITYVFDSGEHHGIYRNIPMSNTLEDTNFMLPYVIHSVIDETGKAYTYADNSTPYEISLKIGDPDKLITGEHTYVISYSVSTVMTSQPDFDELYWNVTGNEWEVPIIHADAVVHLPDTATPLKLTCFTGSYKENTYRCESTKPDDQSAQFSTTDNLYYKQGLTLAIGITKNTVAVPGIVNITSSPSPTSIVINTPTESTYTTPANIRLLPGNYDVRTQRLGYETQTQTIQVQAGTTQNLNVTLQPIWWKTIFEMYLPIIGSALLFFVIVYRGMRYGKEPKGRGTIIPQYEAPAQLTPGEVGILTDQKADMHDISASIINLAVKGYITIERLEKGRKDTYTFIKQSSADAEKLPVHEKTILNGLFSGNTGTKVTLAELKNKFYVHLEDIKNDLYSAVTDKKLFREDPKKVRAKHYALATLMGILSIGSGVGLFMLGLDGTWYFASLGFITLVLFIRAPFMPQRTKQGSIVYEEILGFKRFLNVAEKDRIKFFNSPKAYEKAFMAFLPYAIVFGLEKDWAKQFEHLGFTPPDWYSGGNMLQFNASMLAFNHLTAHTLSSAPRSSGGSGGSGFSGGFSGGGFGGGGGSSW